MTRIMLQHYRAEKSERCQRCNVYKSDTEIRGFSLLPGHMSLLMSESHCLCAFYDM